VSVLGTRFYRAPEHLLLISQDLSAEIWGLGCIFLEILKYCVIFDQRTTPNNMHNSRNPIFKKFAKKGPIFRGKSCELFSLKNKKNFNSFNQFKKLICRFMSLNQKYYQREDVLKVKLGIGQSRTDPRIFQEKSFKSRNILLLIW
jgi:serine/threonine protein kinase